MSCDSSLSASTPSTRNTSSSATASARCTKRRSSAGIAASISSRITDPRRRLLERGLEQPHQIFGLFLDFDVGVADDPEGALPLHGVAGEQPADEQPGGLLERDHADGLIGCRSAAG